jgi:uncharacterized protein YycO
MKKFEKLFPIQVLLLLLGCSKATPNIVQEGDLIFQTSRSAQSVAIQKATHSRYSHMGMVLFRDGQPYVFEAAAGVRYTPLKQWINRGEDGHYVVKRLIDATHVLGPIAIERLHGEADKYAGKAYDSAFEWTDERFYCSELVWKIYDRALHIDIGHTQQLKDFDLDDPVVKSALQDRYGKSIPLEQQVISPAAMFNSPKLVTVASK